MSHQAMSMEAMLDEERREVLALLERRPAARRSDSANDVRSSSPFTTPRSPVRSMLDIGGPVPAPAPATRSLLDVDSPPPSATRQTFSERGSSPEGSVLSHTRSMSDAASKPPADLGPWSTSRSKDPTAAYQFSDIITSKSGPALPKRVSQGGKRASNSMAELLRSGDLSNLVFPGERGRHSSTGGATGRPGAAGGKSKSPHNRLGVRSQSPALLSGRQLSPAGRAVLDDGRTVDINHAYRRLSDANLAWGGGSLSELARRKQSEEQSNTGRLAKVYFTPDGEALPEESSDDDGPSSTDEEGERGRKTERPSTGSDPDPALTKEARKTLSLLAAAEEERKQVAASQPAYKYRSLFDEPEITVTNPSGEKVKQDKSGVHPSTSFDVPSRSGSRTPMDSEEEQDYTDIKRAQKLSFSTTPVMSNPDTHRAIRIIYRGDYGKIQKEAEEEHMRLRKYLVATDMSEESTHALEWAIGTVLRDGDTLIALYCVDEETGIVTGDGALVPDEPGAMKEQAAAINAVANNNNNNTNNSSTAAAAAAGSGSGSSSAPPSTTQLPLMTLGGAAGGRPLTRAQELSQVASSPAPSVRERSKAEEERFRAIQDITERVTKLLRKTRLQVRVIVEVLHCKNPKHLITEVIDVVNPTLVILGSRGRSALKGVILGSFSNYLVTKSSVPVMVARKRLRKQGKYKRPAVNQVNNLSNPTAKSLASAKID
ncbi:uncharacterized protein E0L32_004475 [Thyridium curvatum]|uniref:UspA domain-containing protein n=1 Tax=Thyridium curvatum TaxID=1093900 RepID=A0A507AXI1_9PEZI|nr:uncharacterized protein E0L32_004475 [Thyridium curvatum]TPX15495.1 hypothetical protein E0L32_004475 [Thyridium curvatum]